MNLWCPNCTQPLVVPEQVAGQPMHCPLWRGAFTAPPPAADPRGGPSDTGPANSFKGAMIVYRPPCQFSRGILGHSDVIIVTNHGNLVSLGGELSSTPLGTAMDSLFADIAGGQALSGYTRLLAPLRLQRRPRRLWMPSETIGATSRGRCAATASAVAFASPHQAQERFASAVPLVAVPATSHQEAPPADVEFRSRRPAARRGRSGDRISACVRRAIGPDGAARQSSRQHRSRTTAKWAGSPDARACHPDPRIGDNAAAALDTPPPKSEPQKPTTGAALQGRTSLVQSVVNSPDGKTLATGRRRQDDREGGRGRRQEHGCPRWAWAFRKRLCQVIHPGRQDPRFGERGQDDRAVGRGDCRVHNINASGRFTTRRPFPAAARRSIQERGLHRPDARHEDEAH